MALAGPGANLAMVLLAALVIRIGVGLEQLEPPGSVFFTQVTVVSGATAAELAGIEAEATRGLGTAMAYMLSLFFSMNLLLFLLNMIPLPPLDGSGAMPLLLPAAWNDAYQGVVRQPLFAWIGILIAWQIFGEIFHPCFFFAIRLLYPDVHYG